MKQKMNQHERPVMFVVEDNVLYQQLIAKELETFTDTIFFFTNGEDCLKELNRCPAIVIMDYNLDGKLNGLETIRQIRIIQPNVQVILFSSETDLYTRENLLTYGRFQFLKKTMQSFAELKQVVQLAELRVSY